MFDLAALPLPSLPVSATSLALENVGNSGDPGELMQGGGFEALLAFQSAQPLAPVPARESAPASPATVPASGKILPEAAVPVAAVAASLTQVRVSDGEAVAATEDERPQRAKAEAALPDQAMIAAIFAAPQRLGPTTKAEQPETRADRTTSNAAKPVPMRPADAATPVANGQPNPVAFAQTIAIAQSASIELAPSAPQDVRAQAPEAAPKAAPNAAPKSAPAMAAQSGAIKEAGASAKPAAPEAAKPSVADDDTDSALLLDTADDLIAPVLHRTAEAAPQQDAAPVSRVSHRPERIDFATLVDTLNRAREDAEPNAVRVSVAHADFGRVSMRFEQDDTGMSVSMSSADPGFARAVTASNEGAAASSNSETLRDQNPQPQARGGGNASGEGTRQQQQQSPRAETSERPAAELRDAVRREDDTAAHGGIFA